MSALPTLELAGFTASVDAYALAPHSDPRQHGLWFLSLLGTQEAVKALWARLLKGEVAVLHPAEAGRSRFCLLHPEATGGWRFHTTRLPQALGYQSVLLPECARFRSEQGAFLLLPRDPAEAAPLHFRFLNRRVNLPLYPAWADWLWARALRCDEARSLESYGIAAYHCVPDSAALATALTEAVQAGRLTVERHECLPANGNLLRSRSASRGTGGR